MEPQTDLVLEAIGHGDRAALLRRLRSSGGETEAALRLALGMDQTSATRALNHLRLVGLLERDRRRGPYRLTFPDETGSILDLANDLARRISEARLHVDRQLRD